MKNRDEKKMQTKNINMVLPEVPKVSSNVKDTVTASMFLNNNVNIDNVKSFIELEKVDPNLYGDIFLKKDVNNHQPFKRYNVPNNTIVLEGKTLKIINPSPVKKVISVDLEEIKRKEAQKNIEPSPEQPKIIRLGGIDTINELISKDEKLKELIKEEVQEKKPEINQEPIVEEIPQVEEEVVVAKEPEKKELITTYVLRNDKQKDQDDIYFSYQKNINENTEVIELKPSNSMFIKKAPEVDPIEFVIPNDNTTTDDVIIKPRPTAPFLPKQEVEPVEIINIVQPKNVEPIKIINKEVYVEPTPTIIENIFVAQEPIPEPVKEVEVTPPVQQKPIEDIKTQNNDWYDPHKIIIPIDVIRKEIVRDQYPEEIIETKIPEPEANIEDNIKPQEDVVVETKEPELEPGVPKKLYRRLWEQEAKDKIITNFDASMLPQKGELIDYPDVDYAIEMIDIYKAFDNGKILANNGVNLRVRRNNVHALIGENGAGKSVLMSILFGIYNADSGIIKVNGEEVIFSSAKDAALRGIGMVHQHFKLVETNTVFENIILGLEDTSSLGFLKTHDARNKINNLIQKYNFNIDIDKKIENLNVADQQKTEILKLLYRDADILIFDEPTAVLSESEIKQFLDIVKQLKNDGKTIILITHKFNEIKEVADRGTVIRLGTFISEFDINEKTEQEIIAEMVGNNLENISNVEQGKYSEETVFEVNNLVIDEKVSQNPINFKVNKGQIFAIAGVTGNGQSELALIMAGLLKNKSGSININSNDISKLSVSKRYESGLAYVPEDRHKYSVILDLPIYMNTVIDKVDKKPYSKSGFISLPIIKEYTRNFIKKNDIRGTSRGTAPIRNLSGGNQQKLVIAREFDRDYEVLVLEQPTRGLDVAAINKIHKEILEEKAKGKAIVLISYELDEILSIADTVAVMNKYEIVDISNINETDRNKIGRLMVGENA